MNRPSVTIRRSVISSVLLGPRKLPPTLRLAPKRTAGAPYRPATARRSSSRSQDRPLRGLTRHIDRPNPGEAWLPVVSRRGPVLGAPKLTASQTCVRACMRAGFRDTHHINNTAAATTHPPLHTRISTTRARARFARFPLMMIAMISTPRTLAAPGRPGRPARELVRRNSNTVTYHGPRSDLGRPSRGATRISASAGRSAAALFKRVGTRCTRRDTEKDCHGSVDWERGRWRLLAPLARQRSV